MPDGRGFMRDEKAPGGCVYRVDPDGKHWDLVSMGYRNPYDMAFNRDGDLFTYDSDMEWDVNTPWYRPTRVCQAVSGSDFGYRNGSGKWPTVLSSTACPPSINIGPGSPDGHHLRLRREVPGEVPAGPLSLRLELRQALRRPPEARRRLGYSGRARGVRHRHAAAADRHRRQPEGRCDVLRHRRPEHHVGALPRDLRRDASRPPRARPTAGGDRGPRLRRTLEAFHGHAETRGRRGRLAVPRPPRPLHPLRRPGGHRVAGPGHLAGAGPGRDRRSAPP